MDTLSDLEKQGFSVDLIRNKLRSLLLIKIRHDQGHSISEEINKLEKERRTSAILEHERRNSEISGLQLSSETMKETLESSRREFDKLFEAPWLISTLFLFLLMRKKHLDYSSRICAAIQLYPNLLHTKPHCKLTKSKPRVELLGVAGGRQWRLRWLTWPSVPLWRPHCCVLVAVVVFVVGPSGGGWWSRSCRLFSGGNLAVAAA